MDKEKDNENVVIVTDRKTIESIFEGILRRNLNQKNIDPSVEFEKDRISKSQASELAGISIPTLDRRIKEGKFKQYNLGTRKYFLKSEVIESLRSNS